MRSVWTIVAVSLLLMCGEALAQDDSEEGVIELDAIQIDMIRKGIAAENAGDFKEAIRLHRAAVTLGNSNVAQVNLGRAYQKKGDCKMAHETFLKALEAPKVKDPDPKTVTEAIESLMVELGETCPGTLKVVCASADTSVEIDGEAAQCNSEISLSAGKHAVVATLGDERQENQVTIVGMATETLEISLEPVVVAEKKEDEDEADGPARPEESSASGGGLLLVITGVALVGGGAVMSVQVDKLNEEADKLSEEEIIETSKAQSILDDSALFNGLQFVGYGLGALSLGVGIYLMSRGGDEQSEPTGRLAPMVVPGGGGAVWTSPF